MTDKEYIERDSIIQFITNGLNEKRFGFDAIEILTEIQYTPAADVVSVKYGHWKPISESEMTGFNPKFAGRDPIAGYKCSNCSNEAIFSCNDEFVLSDYCPNCGAKMDGGDDT